MKWLFKIMKIKMHKIIIGIKKIEQKKLKKQKLSK